MKFPMQPIEIDEDGIARFVANRIVRWLLDAGPFDLNQIALLPGITREEHEQFAQLIGYSLSGFGDLNYVSDEAYKLADDRVAELRIEELKE